MIAAIQLKIGVSISTLVNLFLLIRARRSLQTDLLLFVQTDRLVYPLLQSFILSVTVQQDYN